MTSFSTDPALLSEINHALHNFGSCSQAMALLKLRFINDAQFQRLASIVFDSDTVNGIIAYSDLQRQYILEFIDNLDAYSYVDDSEIAGRVDSFLEESYVMIDAAVVTVLDARQKLTQRSDIDYNTAFAAFNILDDICKSIPASVA